MKGRVLALFAAGMLAATPAFAADLSTKAPVYKAPFAVPFTWTGCYIRPGRGAVTTSITAHRRTSRVRAASSAAGSSAAIIR